VRQAKLRSPDSSKYDAFQDLFNAQGPSSETSKLDPLGNLLQSVRQTKLRSPDSNKYDVFQALFNAQGPSSETAPLDPVGNLLQNVSQPRQTPVKSKYDPFQAIFNAPGPSEQAPALDPLGALLEGARKPWTSVTSKYDPFQAMFSAEAASGDAQLDPLPHVIRGLKARAQLALHRKGAGPGAAITRLDKYDLVYQILSSQPASGQSVVCNTLLACSQHCLSAFKRSCRRTCCFAIFCKVFVIGAGIDALACFQVERKLLLKIHVKCFFS